MARVIQIRNVPEDLYRTLKARAAHAGMSLSDYLLNEVRQVAARPTLDELVERLRRRKPIRTEEASAEIIGRHRGAS
jgi:plasmid stability protein